PRGGWSAARQRAESGPTRRSPSREPGCAPPPPSCDHPAGGKGQGREEPVHRLVEEQGRCPHLRETAPPAPPAPSGPPGPPVRPHAEHHFFPPLAAQHQEARALPLHER